MYYGIYVLAYFNMYDCMCCLMCLACFILSARPLYVPKFMFACLLSFYLQERRINSALCCIYKLNCMHRLVLNAMCMPCLVHAVIFIYCGPFTACVKYSPFRYLLVSCLCFTGLRDVFIYAAMSTFTPKLGYTRFISESH